MIHLHPRPNRSKFTRTERLDLHAAEMRALSTSTRKREAAQRYWAQRRSA